MKKNLLIIFAFSFTIITNAQLDSKDKVIDAIAQSSCECVNKKNIDLSQENNSKLEMEFGLCIMEGYSKYKTDADKFLSVSFNDEDSLEKLGEDVALKMVIHCPEVLMSLAGNYVGEEEEEATESTIEIYGEFSKIKKEQFNTVTIKDNDNRNHKILWLSYFEGSDLFEDVDELKGKKLRVVCIEMELYDPKISEYRNFKVLKKVTIL